MTASQSQLSEREGIASACLSSLSAAAGIVLVSHEVWFLPPAVSVFLAQDSCVNPSCLLLGRFREIQWSNGTACLHWSESLKMHGNPAPLDQDSSLWNSLVVQLAVLVARYQITTVSFCCSKE